MMKHETVAEGTSAGCTCGWSIDYRFNRYMTQTQQVREAARAARLHPVQMANREWETTPSRDGWTGD